MLNQLIISIFLPSSIRKEKHGWTLINGRGMIIKVQDQIVRFKISDSELQQVLGLDEGEFEIGKTIPLYDDSTRPSDRPENFNRYAEILNTALKQPIFVA